MSLSSSYAEQIGREGSSRTIDETDLYVGSVQWNTQAAQIFLLYHVDVNSNPIPETWKTIRKVSMYAKSKAAYALTIGGFSHHNLAENVVMENVALTANQIVGGGFFMVSPASFFGETFLGSSGPLIAPQAIYRPYLESEIFKEVTLQAAEAVRHSCQYVLLPLDENENLYQIPPHTDENVLGHWLQYVDVQVKEEEPNFKE